MIAGTENGWKDKFDPEDEEAGRDQKLPDDLLDTIASKYNPQKWLWLDWACAQPLASMRALNRCNCARTPQRMSERL
eukprot:2088010-Pleurochrysis_carterae.AAC.3